MLSQHQSSLGVGRESRTGASRHHLLAFPRNPQQVLLAGICSGLQHQLGVLSPPAPIFVKQHKTSACEYGVSHSAQYTRPRQTKKEVDRRSMTRMSTQSTPQPPARNIQFNIPSHDTNNTPFTFVAQPRPAMTLHFPPRYVQYLRHQVYLSAPKLYDKQETTLGQPLVDAESLTIHRNMELC
ncbi:hypothetical protein BDV96DRAFT_184293 [Lophiotrema nucula]|uniref:Uncharacterized protein n=1 Tax=Lophiotrema nucula TaxID=690887 RepID=A0A6A5YZG4_9PLEO|nr:hypothetical protein BDV96DRAFT_184293 [Lophiotrema nucula]